MQEAYASTPTEPTDRLSPGERKCIVTGCVRSKSELVRFVVGPDATITPDITQNLPGRGLWVTADAANIAAASLKNTFARAAKQPVKVPADLTARVEKLLRAKCLDLAGLCKRAGLAVLGQPQVEAAIKNEKVTLVLLAPDAGSDLSLTSQTCFRILTRDELGAALGHDQIVYAAFKPHTLTARLKSELKRLEQIDLNSKSSLGCKQQ